MMLLLLVLGCSCGRGHVRLESPDTGKPETGDSAPVDTDTGRDTDTAPPVETADTDTGDSAPVDTDTAAPCSGVVGADPDPVALVQDGPAVSVTMSGCARPLVVTCDSWILVSGAPGELAGSAVLSLSAAHGEAAPADGSCDLSGYTLSVHLDAS